MNVQNTKGNSKSCLLYFVHFQGTSSTKIYARPVKARKWTINYLHLGNQEYHLHLYLET